MVFLFVIAAQAADAVTLALGAPVVGIRAEQNPLARQVYSDGGVLATFGFKAVLVAMMIGVIAYFGRTKRQRIILAAIAGGMGIFGTVGNILAIMYH